MMTSRAILVLALALGAALACFGRPAAAQDAGLVRGTGGRSIIGRHVLWERGNRVLRIFTSCLFGILVLAIPHVLRAQEGAPAPSAPPPKVQQLIELLRKPEIQAWLEQGPAPASPGAVENVEDAGRNLARDFRIWVAQSRSHLTAIRTNSALIPGELARIGKDVAVEIRDQGFWRILLLTAGLLVLGYGIQKLFWTMTRGWRKHVLAMPMETVQQRLSVVGLRFGYNVLWLTSFALGSLGALLVFQWPPMLKTILSAVFIIITVALLWGVMARFLLSPHNRRLRVFPVDDAAAQHWTRWSAILLSWFFGGWVAMQVLRDFDVDEPIRAPIAYVLGLVLFGLAMVALWRRPALSDPQESQRDRARNITLSVSMLFAALWLVWVFGAMQVFWLVAVAATLPAAVSVVDRSVDHILTPPGVLETKGPPSVLAAALERGARAFLIVGAIWVLAWGWGIDLDTLTAADTAVTRLLRGLFNGILILLVADFAWHVVRTIIDQRIHASSSNEGSADPNEASRRARMRTLLPILRNILFIVFLVMAVLMALSAMGVQIAPLIAGAGVVGVAVGFGAQTLVKDVISGIFYLLDDAFRVGEYIISGSYKGTVESFSLRSIKLRHHRGYLYTVPFGSLGAVQNMSRDWVIDKMTIGVTYDTDLDRVKKIIKQIGKELQSDPDLAPHILQTLKMQGVEEYGEYAIKIRMKMMTKPGEQFVIRRRAYALIKKAFAENGIQFAFPTVQVAGGEPAAAAAATQAATHAAKPAAA
jgi:small-conductance mechanosensitive channel